MITDQRIGEIAMLLVLKTFENVEGEIIPYDEFEILINDEEELTMAQVIGIEISEYVEFLKVLYSKANEL